MTSQHLAQPDLHPLGLLDLGPSSREVVQQNHSRPHLHARDHSRPQLHPRDLHLDPSSRRLVQQDPNRPDLHPRDLQEVPSSRSLMQEDPSRPDLHPRDLQEDPSSRLYLRESKFLFLQRALPKASVWYVRKRLRREWWPFLRRQNSKSLWRELSMCLKMSKSANVTY